MFVRGSTMLVVVRGKLSWRSGIERVLLLIRCPAIQTVVLRTMLRLMIQLVAR
jgi:hypothetical protein